MDRSRSSLYQESCARNWLLSIVHTNTCYFLFFIIVIVSLYTHNLTGFTHNKLQTMKAHFSSWLLYECNEQIRLTILIDHNSRNTNSFFWVHFTTKIIYSVDGSGILLPNLWEQPCKQTGGGSQPELFSGYFSSLRPPAKRKSRCQK